MKKEIYEISSSYMRDLKKMLNNKKISPYDIAHASIRKNNAHWIIQGVDKRSLEITYLCGDTKQFSSYNKLMKEVNIVNAEYKKERKKHLKKYYKIIHTFTKHRKEMKERTKNTISNILNPEKIRLLAQQL